MFKEFQIAILVITVLIALIGLYLSILAWSSWRHMDDDVLRARAFLTRKFLTRNFILVFVSGAFVGFHSIFELVDIFGYPSALMQFEQEIQINYLLTLTFSMFLLVLLAYNWCRLISIREK